MPINLISIFGHSGKPSKAPAPAAPPKNSRPDPTFADLAGNFTQAMAVWAAAGFPIASKEVCQARKATCEACAFWDGTARFGAGKCNSPKCGCTRLKWWMATSKCPEGKWPLSISSPSNEKAKMDTQHER